MKNSCISIKTKSPIFQNTLITTLFLLILFFTNITNVCGNVNDFILKQENPDIPTKPSPPRLVNDFAHVLSSQEISLMENALVKYAEKTSTQIVIVSVPTIGNYEIAQYAVELALNWKIGTKDKDNGLLILFSLKERKVTIQTGYGLEEKIPDIEASRIIRSIIQPLFKKGQYFEGLKLTINRVVGLIQGEFVNENPSKSKKKNFSITTFLIIFIIFLVIVRMISKRRGGNNNNKGGGGGFFPVFLPFGGGGTYSNTGYSDSDFGGFGGFGGGDFGGGGASGDW